MSNYVKATNFYAKDALLTGDPAKIIKGSEIDAEYNAIATAVGTKADLNSPTFTGVPVAPTASPGTNTTQLATTGFVQNVAGSLGTLSSQDADSVAITGGSITGITDLAVEDGGTGQSALAANAVLIGNGTSGINSVAPSTSGNVLTSNGTAWTSAENWSIGVGQTWQDVAGSRSLDTDYVNSTGKPIMVAVSARSSINNAGINPTVDGVVISYQLITVGYASASLSFIVPNGSTYRVSRAGGTESIMLWTELR